MNSIANYIDFSTFYCIIINFVGNCICLYFTEQISLKQMAKKLKFRFCMYVIYLNPIKPAWCTCRFSWVVECFPNTMCSQLHWNAFPLDQTSTYFHSILRIKLCKHRYLWRNYFQVIEKKCVSFSLTFPRIIMVILAAIFFLVLLYL